MHILEADKAIRSGFTNTGYGMIVYLDYVNNQGGYMLSENMRTRLDNAARSGTPIHYHHTVVRWDPERQVFPDVKLAVETWDLNPGDVNDDEISIDEGQ